MRVGYIAYAFDRPLSGISRYSIELLKALHALDSTPDIFVLSAGEMGPLANSGFQQIPLRGCEKLPSLLTLGSGLIRQIISRYNLDVLHDPNGVNPFMMGKGNAKTVVTIHDVIPLSFPGFSTRLDTLIYQHWLPRVVPYTDTIITVSQASKANIAQYLHVPESRIHAIPIAMGQNFKQVEDTLVTQVLARYAISEKYILYVGSVEERKNLRRVFEAYHCLKLRNIPHKLVVVGAQKWHYAQIMDMLDVLDLRREVILMGHVDEEDLPAIYTGADVFVFPSLYEGFGLPVLEAMACGTPVVTSNVSSLPEVVGDAALLVNPYDVDALVDAIFQVLSNPQLRIDLNHKGLKRAGQFHWKATAEATYAIYQSLCASDRP